MRRPLVLAALVLGALGLGAAGLRAQPVPTTAHGVAEAFAHGTPAEADALWHALVAAGRVPFVVADTAVFLWRPPEGAAPQSVAVAADLNGWTPAATALRPTPSGVWLRAVALPTTARIDYKIVLDDTLWTLDPANPHRQWGGAGPNSELRMPDWHPEPWTVRRPDVPAGTLAPPDTLAAGRSGPPVVVRVYAPAGADTLGALPVLYVTDGHEYADDRLGALVTVLDHAVASGRVTPLRAVFIDPRWGGQNLRMQQYVGDVPFAAFVAETLVPWVEARYPTAPGRANRAILGTSLGGLFAAFLGTESPEVFGKWAIQSPAFWAGEPNDRLPWSGPSIYARVAALPARSVEVFLSAGTIGDTAEEARRMVGVLGPVAQRLTYVEVAEGHSWGNWRALLDDALVALFPAGR